MANKLVIEIRHAAAARAATDGNTDSVAPAPAAPPDVKTKPDAPVPSKPNKNKGAQEPTPPYAKENVGDQQWQAAEAAAMKKMHTALKGK